MITPPAQAGDSDNELHRNTDTSILSYQKSFIARITPCALPRARFGVTTPTVAEDQQRIRIDIESVVKTKPVLKGA